jgi:hypothetical protein
MHAGRPAGRRRCAALRCAPTADRPPARPPAAGKLLLPDERNMLAVDENPYESKVMGELERLKIPHVRLKRGE